MNITLIAIAHTYKLLQSYYGHYTHKTYAVALIREKS